MPRKYIVSRPKIEQPSDESIKYIPLTKSKIAIVDAADYEELNQHHWCANENNVTGDCYAIRRNRETKSTIGMHSQLIPCKPGNVPDHVNGNTLDNRRKNLQEIPHALNLLRGADRRPPKNNTGIRGVHFIKSRNKYMAHIGPRSLGRFDTIELASAARDREIQGLYGKFMQHPARS